MSESATQAMLRGIPLFAGLNAEHLVLIASALHIREFKPGQDIYRQGDPAQTLVIILSGAALLFHAHEDGSHEPLRTLRPYQHINHDALLETRVHSATLRASQNLAIAELTRDSFNMLLEQHTSLSSALGIRSDSKEAALNPSFAEQREDEEVLIETRRHGWAFLRSAWIPLLLMLAMWAAALLPQTQDIALLLLFGSLILPGLAIVYCYAEWRNDSIIVTDQRIIRVERTILAMRRQITQVGLESVQEINFEIPAYDPFARIFRYGTVFINTAGAQGNLQFDLVPRPAQFQKLLIEDRQYFENRKAQRHQAMVRGELQRWLAGDNPSLDEDLARPSTDPDAPPKPIAGSSYLSARILMSNGDIVYRKHISVWVQHTSIPIIIILVSLAALLLTFTIVSPDLRALTFPIAMVALLVGSVSYYWMDWDWRNDIYVISDDTITLVHKRPFFLQNLRDQILVERIDNVESIRTGLLAAIMKYGDVRMSLIGADEHKLFHKVSRPQEIQQEISRRQHKKAQRRARYDAMQQRQILSEYLNAAQALPTNGSPANSNGIPPARETSTHNLRAAQNRDRNRPPRVPRKSLP